MIILLSILILLLFFLGYVSTRSGKFHYERSGIINASAEKIFPYISNLKQGELWNPYSKKDPNLKKNFIGSGNQVGSVMEFAGNREAGTGKLEILKITPNQLVEINLVMTKPMRASNIIQYKLTPDTKGTRFTWAMSGDGGFMGKLVSVIIDCEKMVARDFEVGIENLKSLVERTKN